MPREVCWHCKEIKNNVKLCADDRLCDDCEHENDRLLELIRFEKSKGQSSSAMASARKRLSADVAPAATTMGTRVTRRSARSTTANTTSINGSCISSTTADISNFTNKVELR